MKKRKILRQALSGSRNIRFADMVSLAEGFGFRQVRVKGSHHIFGGHYKRCVKTSGGRFRFPHNSDAIDETLTIIDLW
jgi:predicted RNA binding protein YcfA (HicA-like mRNA interferase family)